jgi:UDP-N-acetylmuramyl pentapeptide phosphotransferase/UDP-N-acetylglucosamine-1-phosphate transferase
VIAGVVVAFAAALAAIPALGWWARSRSLLDIPNERSSHTNPTPRVGGIGIIAAVALGLVVARLTGYAMPAHLAVLAAGALVLAAISVVDDVQSLPALVRLVAQSAIGGATAWQVAPVLSSGQIPPGLATLVAALWIVGLVNAYNFMDGIDGIAAGQAIVAASGWALVGAITGLPGLTGTALVLAAACAAFLRFNWPPARVFMGDGGSAFLGFAFAVLPLADPSPGLFLPAAACFVWPFLFDTSFTFLRRLSRGENVLQAHRSHLYQRLTSTGLSHGRVAAIYTALAALGLPAGVCLASGRWSLALVVGAVVPIAAVSLWSTVVRREARAGVRFASRGRGESVSGR